MEQPYGWRYGDCMGANALARRQGRAGYSKHQLTNAVTAGAKSKIQALQSAARGFRNFQNYRFTENLPAR